MPSRPEQALWFMRAQRSATAFHDAHDGIRWERSVSRSARPGRHEASHEEPHHQHHVHEHMNLLSMTVSDLRDVNYCGLIGVLRAQLGVGGHTKLNRKTLEPGWRNSRGPQRRNTRTNIGLSPRLRNTMEPAFKTWMNTVLRGLTH